VTARANTKLIATEMGGRIQAFFNVAPARPPACRRDHADVVDPHQLTTT
jgi:hypothetical protein